MRKKQRSMLGVVMVMAFITVGLFLPGLISGGDLEPSAPPGPTMHTLEEIYSLISARVGGVPVTGQTTSYATGDDGDLEEGVTWPTPRFSDNGDGTVTDNLTGLIWLKNAHCFGYRVWADALSDCNSLASGSCGLTDGSSVGDWRLPNRKELQSLIDCGRSNPALPSGHPFTDVQLGVYWTSTTQAQSTDNAWGIDPGGSNVLAYNKLNDYSVWPVRAGQ